MFENRDEGFTILEITIVTVILLILLAVSFRLISPVSSKNRAQDNKRLSDISTLDRAINEYKIDSGQYPGEKDILYSSYLIPTGSADIYSSTSGWVPADLSSFISKYPTDPINNAEYHYEYTHDSDGYEINARLTYLTEESLNDGGNDPEKYELGNNLSLISP